MVGLEYILSLYNMQYITLADRLGIKKQNINMWIKGKQKIPKKYLPILEEMFGVKQEYFVKELNEIEKLELQKEKLKKDLNPVIECYEKQFLMDEVNGLVDVPIYDKEEINKMERTIEKAKVISKFKDAMDIVEDNPYIDTYKLMAELMEKAQHEPLVHKTLQSLAHYFNILPDNVSTGLDQDDFEEEIIEVFENNNY
ncbi:helix-turn-helix domain-containing protein [Clostridium gasigenes]|uniref:helix-turn-helix domain-containing protein n=1 Tax=Clostridium gasigenes TaxID=94869 RepID=UPI00162A9606|nr:helix-turn-helix domain-containing protein [Clostridium gasigenes]MBB6625095.1 helix-turn-helix domain-containing protein [Clostridium gasigenes]MBU3138033.1 helix-turn-helix domain-containing protein [Clostridium gasigenes]